MHVAMHALCIYVAKLPQIAYLKLCDLYIKQLVNKPYTACY